MGRLAVIFDLNGTLVDTEIAHGSAYGEVLGKHGINFSLSDFTDHWTRQGKKMGDYLTKINRHDLLNKEKDLIKKKDEIFDRSFVQHSRLMPFAREVLEHLKKKDFILAVDSSTSQENLEKLLKHFGLLGFFDYFSSRDTDFDEAKYGDRKKKSSRLKFLLDKMKLPSSQSIMIGDAEKDIEGAEAAGIKTIAVPNKYTINNDFSLADQTVKNLSEINSKLILSIINGH